MPKITHMLKNSANIRLRRGPYLVESRPLRSGKDLIAHGDHYWDGCVLSGAHVGSVYHRDDYSNPVYRVVKKLPFSKSYLAKAAIDSSLMTTLKRQVAYWKGRANKAAVTFGFAGTKSGRISSRRPAPSNLPRTSYHGYAAIQADGSLAWDSISPHQSTVETRPYSQVTIHVHSGPRDEKPKKKRK